jgi:phosphoadenosine phosphosulfate reductase
MSPLEDITARRLEARFGATSAEAALAVALDRYEGRIALVSSFGADAAVLLHMLAQIDADVPVLLLDTLLLFPETLAHQRDLTAHLGLPDVRRITPDETQDPDRTLHKRDSVACCALRKIAPLEQALQGFDAVITGRKRFQTGQRAQMATFEQDGALIKVNPLANWSSDQIAQYFEEHALPRHPLVAQGYPSIGCAPCTSQVFDGEDPRSGRWRDEQRQECGIHFGADGRIERKAI